MADWPARLHGTAVTLLNGMRQLVRQQLVAVTGFQLEFTLAEINVLSVGKGIRINILRCARGLPIRVHPHSTQIHAEARLEEGA